VRWLLVLSGYRDPGAISSGAYGSYLAPGRGERVTFYFNGAHIWADIGGSAWQTSTTNPDHGPGWTGWRSTSGWQAGHVAGL
jgi:hypothetical protein